MAETPMVAASQDPSMLASRLRASLLQALRDGLRGGVDGGAARSLRAARAAVRANALDGAVRSLDQAWRRLPECAATLAPIYGRLLMLAGGDSGAARVARIGVESAVRAGSGAARALAAPSRVTNDGQKPSTQL